jgi:hypothetical protein
LTVALVAARGGRLDSMLAFANAGAVHLEQRLDRWWCMVPLMASSVSGG